MADRGTRSAGIVEAATGVFLRYGFSRTTMGDIAGAAGISRPALYLVFPSKDDVFAAVVRHIDAKWHAELTLGLDDQPSAEARIRHMQARALLYEVAGRVAAGDPDAQLGVLALKAAAAEMAIAVTDETMRVCGGAAFSRHLPLERLFRDARAATVMAPTSDVLRDLLGRALTGQPLFE